LGSGGLWGNDKSAANGLLSSATRAAILLNCGPIGRFGNFPIQHMSLSDASEG